TGLRLARGAPRGGGKPGVPLPSFAAPRCHDLLSVMEQICEAVPAVRIFHHRADRHGNDQGASPSPVAGAPFPMTAPLRPVVPAVLKIQQRGEALISHKDHVAAAAAVAAVRPAFGHKFLATEAHTAIAAIAALDVDDRLVNEHDTLK